MNLEHQWGVRVETADDLYVMNCSSRSNAEGAMEGMHKHHPLTQCELVSRVVAYGSWDVEQEE